jgi:hypothetical protein
MGTYFRIENKWVGLGLGLYYYPSYNIETEPGWGSIIDESVVKMGKTVPMASLRIGKRSGYFIDATLYDNHIFNYFPQPTGSLGLINWGFKDPSGNSNLRLGLVYMQDELGYTISGKVPIKNTGFTLGAGFYFQHGMLFSGGLYYRLPLR